MAIIDYTIRGYGDAERVAWGPMTQADTCQSVALNGAGPVAASFQVTGTFGGATVALHGSNDDVSYFPLKDVAGAAIGLTAAGLVELSSAAIFIKPVITGGAGASLTIIVSSRG